mmetsp:Transcript_7975/g.17761  ORF Transcript_7975/g.17761 Transcript_7975/m.17761 type:complete len:381 (-) Transcript_7975:136-1278(-)
MTRAKGSSNGELYLPAGERAELTRELEACDQDIEAARKNADYQQLLVSQERGLYLRRRLYAEDTTQVAGACRRLCEACNCTATVMLQQGNLRGAHDLLKRAEQVSDKSDLDRAITWNNLACYYRRMGKLRTAVTYLERALEIEEFTRDADAAQTHLNLCATLSQLERHADALYHAQSALIRVYEILSPAMLQGKLNQKGSSDGGQEPQEEEDHSSELVTVLCIAYHNLAVEHEYLKNYEAAVCAYAEGVRWSSKFLQEGHQLCGILRESVEALRPKLPPNSGAARRVAELKSGWDNSKNDDVENANSDSQNFSDDPSGSQKELTRRAGDVPVSDLVTPRTKAGQDPTLPQGDATGAHASVGGYSGEDFASESPRSPSMSP